MKKKSKIPKKIIADFDCTPVELVIDKNCTGGGFDLTGSHPNVHVGINQGSTWGEVVDTLLHEAMEMAFIDMNLGYKKLRSVNTTDHRFFLMSHQEFQDAVSRAGHWVADVISPLRVEFEKITK